MLFVQTRPSSQASPQFHGFGQAKFAFGYLILSSSQNYTSAQAASKINAQFKIGQIDLKISSCFSNLNP
jgi:hypothetical protein